MGNCALLVLSHFSYLSHENEIIWSHWLGGFDPALNPLWIRHWSSQLTWPYKQDTWEVGTGRINAFTHPVKVYADNGNRGLKCGLNLYLHPNIIMQAAMSAQTDLCTKLLPCVCARACERGRSCVLYFVCFCRVFLLLFFVFCCCCFLLLLFLFFCFFCGGEGG